jgi:hypothetical protein
MFLTKKAIPRRTFLKSAQAALALPLLDAMIPAATSWAATPAKPTPRLGFVFIPMGCDHSRWTPPGQGKLDELSPILAPLKPVKDQVTVITNTRLQNAYPGTHDTSNSAFLSAASSKHTESSDYFLGTTVDQIAAQQMGRETASELGSEEGTGCLSSAGVPPPGVTPGGVGRLYLWCQQIHYFRRFSIAWQSKRSSPQGRQPIMRLTAMLRTCH